MFKCFLCATVAFLAMLALPFVASADIYPVSDQYEFDLYYGWDLLTKEDVLELAGGEYMLPPVMDKSIIIAGRSEEHTSEL